MKRILSVLMLIVMLICTLNSCTSLNTYKKRLGSDYEITDISEYVVDLEESLDIDILEAITAKDGDDYVIIIQCETVDGAKQVYDSLDIILEAGLTGVRDGKFVLSGTKKAVNDALGK